MLRRQRLWLSVAAAPILGCLAFAVLHAIAVPVRDEPTFEARIGYMSEPPDARPVDMIRRARRDYTFFPVAGHRGTLRLNQTLIEGDDRVCIIFELPTPLDLVSYYGTLHDQRLISKSYSKADVVECSQ